MANNPADLSVIGASTRLVGRVQGTGGLRLDGQVRGDVAVTGPVEIGPDAQLEGDLSAQSLLVHGQLTGDVQVEGPISITEGAVVQGTLSGAHVAIHPSARVTLRLNTEFELDW